VTKPRGFKGFLFFLWQAAEEIIGTMGRMLFHTTKSGCSSKRLFFSSLDPICSCAPVWIFSNVLVRFACPAAQPDRFFQGFQGWQDPNIQSET